jgi:2-polyprenyl-6-methoxyphenol hydroxylase-like FAD-dependent oxidoreductase
VRIAVIGGGPGGLYFAYLWKRRHPDAQIDLFEQNPEGATWGFGVVFSEQALEFLRADDPETVDAITPRMESWKNITLNLRGQSVEIDGIGFSSIGRLELLTILQQRVRAAGIAARYGATIQSLDELEEYDLIVAADGLNSLVRRSFEKEFGASVSHTTNKFAWYGTTRRFATLSQTFVKTDLGSFNAHHYRYSPAMSTFLVECDAATWQAYGFEHKTIEQSQAICEEIFADTLDGHALVSNKSVWRNFPWIWNENWSHGNMVLIGDALHTAHFSIGSGTKLAIEDAIALAESFQQNTNVQDALKNFTSTRRPVILDYQAAAFESMIWFENAKKYMHLSPLELAFTLMMRSGRVSYEDLKRSDPEFIQRYETKR